MNDLLTPLVDPPVVGTRLPGPKVDSPRFDTTRPRRAAAVLGLAAIVWFAAAGNGTLRSLGIATALMALVVGAAASVSRDRRAGSFLAAAATLLPWLAVRHSPWLIAVNLVVAVALVLTAATVRPGQPIAGRLVELVSGWASALASTRFVAEIIRSEARFAASATPMRRDQAMALGRAAGVAMAVCGLAVLLLASGDALFASYLDIGPLSASLLPRVVASGVGVLVCSAMFGLFRSPAARVPAVRSVRPATLLVTMSGLSITIGAYGLVQIIAVTSGAEYVERRTGLTYAEYARSGFFQLAAVTVLTVLVLTAARSTREHTATGARPLLALAGVLTAGVVSLVATSIVKLVVYADRFGLTMLRVYTITFAVWLGLVAVLTFVALVRASDRWLTPVVLLTVVVGALLMNVANPERLVAKHNVERALEGEVLDLDYLGRLSADALPTILAGFDELGVDSESAPGSAWCVPVDAPDGLFDTNLAVDAAAEAQRRFCSNS